MQTWAWFKIGIHWYTICIRVSYGVVYGRYTMAYGWYLVYWHWWHKMVYGWYTGGMLVVYGWYTGGIRRYKIWTWNHSSTGTAPSGDGPLVLFNLIAVSNHVFKVSKLIPKSYEKVKKMRRCNNTFFFFIISFSKVVKSDDHGYDL